jgi:hypothetical protein
MIECGNCVPLTTAQVVGSLCKSVRSVSVLVHPVGQLRGNGSDCADGVGNRFPVAVVILVQLMATNREVNGGRLIGVEVHGVWISVLLGWHTIVVLNREYLQDEVWRRIRGLRRGR